MKMTLTGHIHKFATKSIKICRVSLAPVHIEVSEHWTQTDWIKKKVAAWLRSDWYLAFWYLENRWADLAEILQVGGHGHWDKSQFLFLLFILKLSQNKHFDTYSHLYSESRFRFFWNSQEMLISLSTNYWQKIKKS